MATPHTDVFIYQCFIFFAFLFLFFVFAAILFSVITVRILLKFLSFVFKMSGQIRKDIPWHGKVWDLLVENVEEWKSISETVRTETELSYFYFIILRHVMAVPKVTQSPSVHGSHPKCCCPADRQYLFSTKNRKKLPGSEF